MSLMLWFPNSIAALDHKCIFYVYIMDCVSECCVDGLVSCLLLMGLYLDYDSAPPAPAPAANKSTPRESTYGTQPAPRESTYGGPRESTYGSAPPPRASVVAPRESTYGAPAPRESTYGAPRESTYGSPAPRESVRNRIVKSMN